MASQPPPPFNQPGGYPPPPQGDWRYQRDVMRQQARMQRDYYRAQQQAYRAQQRGLRRTSIVGPLLMIATGVIFLLVQTGRISSTFFWAWYGRWWPLLLVGIGIVMLLEWGWDSYFHTDEPMMRRRSLGGGVFALVLILGLCGVVFNGMHTGAFGHAFNMDPDSMDEFMGDKHESDQTLVQALPAGYGVTIDNPRGDVTVNGTSDDNQVHIDVHKQVYTRSDSEADRRAQDLSPKVDNDGSQLKISMPTIEGSRADVTVTLPAGTPSTVFSNRGEVHISSIRAAVNVTSNHGDVAVTGITGPVNARINNGDSSLSVHSVTGPVSVQGRAHDLSFSEVNGTATMDGEFFGTTHLQHITSNTRFHTSRTDLRMGRLDGEVEISPNADLSADQVAGPLTLATRNRNVTLERISGDISVTNRNGSVDITAAPPMGNITVENRSGSVDLTVPENVGFNVQAETTNGDLSNDFGLEQTGSDESSHKSYSGAVGKGGPLVRITTTQNDIKLQKASIAPLPPPPPKPPKLSVHDGGDSIDLGKEGLNIQSSDGNSVIIDKNGLRINSSPDGSSVYNRNGTSLVSNADGSKIYRGSDGTRYTTNADGSKIYIGRDGTRITINADGTQNAMSPGGHSLTEPEIRARLAQADAMVKRAAAERDRAKAER
ncbi:MAG: DUF4097 family beta strand repeat-containing protein [Edaphobacter sp.]|uniref:DUF4097 family beta strand repeat-containing protein n=1 Tax=Edaphobacter sp. TaxID=1934404 RepID=UPI00239BB75D|nr:DUF4097 family beta strand repeat-containing protein [Edaphobacter sp.]MDE1178146.1 DUF4097 family beta strand repeat-containing protein [Edaphobacter sp.]